MYAYVFGLGGTKMYAYAFVKCSVTVYKMYAYVSQKLVDFTCCIYGEVIQSIQVLYDVYNMFLSRSSLFRLKKKKKI